jgi:hypothetical protein
MFGTIDMMKSLLGLAAAAAVAFGQYKVEATGAAPSDLAPALGALMQDKGHKVLAPDGKVWCEVWFVKTPPAGPPTSETDVTWKTVPMGSVIGALRFPAAGYDRRGQNIKAGVYTLRYGMQPVNGDHQGVAPQRDFLVITPAAGDTDAAAVGNIDALMNMTRKASGTPHPAVLSIWRVESDFAPGLSQAGEHDWVLQVAIGDIKLAVILVGKTEA